MDLRGEGEWVQDREVNLHSGQLVVSAHRYLSTQFGKRKVGCPGIEPAQPPRSTLVEGTISKSTLGVYLICR